MTKKTILTKNIRFPQENLPSDIDTEHLPSWIQDIQVDYSDSEIQDGKGTYTIRRLHGPSAGDPETPIYMDAQGQPQPITNFSPSLLNQSIQVSVADDSPFLEVQKNITEDYAEYILDENLHDFLKRENKDVSIWNNFIIKDYEDEVVQMITGTQTLTNTQTISTPPIILWKGGAKDFYNNFRDEIVNYDQEIPVDPNTTHVTFAKLNANDDVLEQIDFYDGQYLEGGAGGHGWIPDSPYPVEGSTWGYETDPSITIIGTQALVRGYDFINYGENFPAKAKLGSFYAHLDQLHVLNDDDIILLEFHYNENDEYTITTTEEVPIYEDVVMPRGVSGSLGLGLTISAENQLILGKYNVASNALLVVGNGTDTQNRKNLFEVRNNGNLLLTGLIQDSSGIQQGTIHYNSEEQPPNDSNAILWVIPD